MTETESQQFVSEILKGFWPDWEPADSMYGLWARKLRKFDFEKAKVAIGDWFTETKITGKRPPLNKIIEGLLIRGAYDKSLRRQEPVLAFEIFCEDWQANQIPGGPPVKRKSSFWSPTLAKLTRRDPHEIEQEAERCRQQYIGWWGGNWVIVQEWKRYFDESLL